MAGVRVGMLFWMFYKLALCEAENLRGESEDDTPTPQHAAERVTFISKSAPQWVIQEPTNGLLVHFQDSVERCVQYSKFQIACKCTDMLKPCTLLA